MFLTSLQKYNHRSTNKYRGSEKNLNFPVKNSLINNIAKLVLGAGLAQAISLIAAPLLARIYGPQSFGEQSALLSIASPMVALTSLAFPIAIVIARSEIEALALARLALIGSLILSPVLTGVFFLDGMWLLHLLGLEGIAIYMIMLPVVVLLTTMNMSAGYLLARRGAHGLSAKAAVAASTLGNIAKIILGLSWPNTLSLVAGNAISYIVAPVLANTRRPIITTESTTLSFALLKATAQHHRDFPLLRAPQNFIAAVSQSLPVIGLTAGFGPDIAGQYAIALVLAGAPITLIGNAAQTVLYPRLTEASRMGENTTKLLAFATLGLALAAAPFFLIILFLGPWLFIVLLGSEWQDAGVFAALMVPWLWLGLLNRPSVSLIPVLGLQHGLLFYEIVSTAFKLLAILLCLQSAYSPRLTVGIFSAIGAFAYTILIVWVFWSNFKITRRSSNGKAS